LRADSKTVWFLKFGKNGSKALLGGFCRANVDFFNEEKCDFDLKKVQIFVTAFKFSMKLTLMGRKIENLHSQ